MRAIRTAPGATTIDPDPLTPAERLQYEGNLRREKAAFGDRLSPAGWARKLGVNLEDGSMPYFVSWIKDGRVRRFAYPHADLATALGFASEVLQMDCSDVWISDETGQRIADRRSVAQYAEEEEES